MNEQAFIDAYNMFLQGGYRGSRDEFRTLIESNTDAMNDSFEIFKSGGYNGSIQDYQVLIGVAPGEVKKKTSPFWIQLGTLGYRGYQILSVKTLSKYLYSHKSKWPKTTHG